MKNHVLLIMGLCAFFINDIHAQHIGVGECIEGAIANAHIDDKMKTVNSISKLIDENSSTNNYPDIELSGQFHYQSDVFAFPGEIPFNVPEIPNQQGRLTLGISQPVYTGGVKSVKSKIESVQNLMSRENIQQEKYSLHQSVANLYFSILKIEKSNKVLNESIAILKRELAKISSGVENGIIQKSVLEKFKMELLNLEQKYIENTARDNVLREMLADLTGMDIHNNSLIVPQVNLTDEEVYSPRLNLFQYQESLLRNKSELESSSRRPYVGLFAQGGVGSPNPYNFFITDPDLFYIAGIRVKWNVLDYGRSRRNAEIYSLQTENVKNSKIFLEDKLKRDLQGLKMELDNNMGLLQLDQRAVDLQENIVMRSLNQYQNGMITTSEYLSEVNNLTKVHLGKEIRDISIAEIKYKIYMLTNDFDQ